MAKIDAIRFGIAGGLVSALFCFVFTLIASVTGYGVTALNVMKSFLVGYEISAFGSLIGALYGFALGFTKLFLLAFIYNILSPQPLGDDQEPR